MSEQDIQIPTVVETTWLSVEEVAAACGVDPQWLYTRIEQGLFPPAEWVEGRWRCTIAALRRARRMHAIERDFEAVPELAALVADLLEQLDVLRDDRR